jgi:Protein of unknown function DUF262/HNH endonuclease
MALVYLDAMIPRADFAEIDETQNTSSKKIESLDINQLGPNSYFVPSLRKPDFQRETNSWTSDQLISFIKSFLDNELVPSLILWQSPRNIFVIDGAHRLSAMFAWINDDYGDGHISKAFFSNDIKEEQKKSAASVRAKINSEIGSYKAFSDALLQRDLTATDPIFLSRVTNARTRSIFLQWVEGDAAKAESSFFKINKLGTPLDATEERLLKLRRAPIAIITRSVVRAGTGHKYYSQFNEQTISEIEKLSRSLHDVMFSPEINYPIKTLNLPHGGKSSPIAAYNLLMDLFAYAIVGDLKEDRKLPLYKEDADGAATQECMQKAAKVLKRMVGNEISSLGLHPAVYFYSTTGRHLDAIFLAFIKVFSDAVRSGDKQFFRLFTLNRARLEEFFIENRSVLVQISSAIGSKNRVSKWSGLIELLSREMTHDKPITVNYVLEKLEINTSLFTPIVKAKKTDFSDETKSAAFIRNAISSAQKCPGCGGLIQMEKSVSYDHETPKKLGGTGDLENLQLMHPYCNSIKD